MTRLIHLRKGPRNLFFFTPKRDHFKLLLHKRVKESALKIYKFLNISSRATLKETFTAKYNGVLPTTP